MSRIERVTKFFGQWVVPGHSPAVYPVFESTPSGEHDNFMSDLAPEDETLLADVAKDTFPQEALNTLTFNVDQLLRTVLPDEKVQSISLIPMLDWRSQMPKNAEGSHFAHENRPVVAISREQNDRGKIKTSLEFDFSDEDRVGKFSFEYEDGECTLTSLHTNQYGETIRESDKVKSPLAHAIRMSLFHEALGFFQNERDFRRNLGVTEYNPFRSNNTEGQ